MEKNKTVTKRDNTLTFVQVVCAFAVITLHTNGAFWEFDTSGTYWFSANLIECLFFFAVPLFFMISGITLIDYQDKYTTAVFFKKRVTKTLIPYFIWSGIGLIYHYFMSHTVMGARDIIYGLLNGKIVSVYWFFIPLFCVYFSMPLFAAVEKSKQEVTLRYLLFVGIFVNTLVPFVLRAMGEDTIWPYNVSVVTGYLIWVVTGALVYKYPPKFPTKCLIYVCSVIGFLLHAGGTYILSMREGQIITTYKGYNNLPCFMYALGVFMFLMDIGKRLMKIEIVDKVICTLGKYTFAIYLIHWFVMDFVSVKFAVDTHSLLWRIGAPIPIGLIVVAITWLIRKIPVVKEIVP